ncbi:MAG: Glu/Leu/Phe/Val family dehydrogenase [Bacillota bacterium]
MSEIEKNAKGYRLLSCEEASKHHFERAANKLKLKRSLRNWLRIPFREISVHLPVVMDDGNLHIFEGFRVQHNNARGPHKGGTRFHPRVTLGDVRGLASWMTWKTALLNLPLGGAKGGVACDAKKMSEAELERLTRKYTQAISVDIGPYQDIPAPDVNTDEKVMAWIMDEYSKLRGYSPAVVTGKPVDLGGSPGRKSATGLGVAYIVEQWAAENGYKMEESTAVVQGFGNVGYHSAYHLSKMGCKIVAISDSGAGIVNKEGLDVEKVLKHKEETGSVSGFPGAETVKKEKIFAQKCDFLIPAALENAIKGDNFADIQARVIFEAANGPTCPLCEPDLEAKGITIMPDILVNSGGVVVSYFEWVQNLQQFSWSEEQVDMELQKKMKNAYNRVTEKAAEEKVTMRIAAYMLAIEKVAAAAQTRGAY